ncbi:2Fe-2S iron-sulfur cluster-binding protein [Pseudoalteromonas piratica]|uniref:NADH:ubiquinone oxidoreductase n=1 Tax=Pseudoalteromonas piratica TaxID=1348114 RepID=A0A0A7EJN5_9GAMM|nr:2Fe-2S iron-sulfur cluster-binding protein [Pseudoalteromonas piratica]AIY66147.1 NADH:ubiquinone oxidoreductase [Pseudoalteromonas piratica]
MRLFKLNTAIHKWLSLVVVLQLLIWLGTGLYFNLMDHSKASGNELRVHSHHEGKVTDFSLIPIKDIASEAPQEVKLIWVLHQPYYHFVFDRGQHSYQKRHSMLFDAVTGKPFILSEEQVLTMAKNSYLGEEKLTTPVLSQPPFSDHVSQQNPMWQVVVEDENNTTIYLDSVTGQVLRHANDDFRLKALMMKLHFMDYGNSGGFNHWLIIAFAFATLFLSVTGVTWLIQQYRSGLLKLSWASKRKKVAVTFSNENTITDISVVGSSTVLEGLASSHVYLPSSCGGGGTCGKCTFLSSTQLPIRLPDEEHISEEQLKEGYRLGCQHRFSEITSIEVNTDRNIENHELVVVATNFITPFIKEVKFKVKSDKKLAFKAGAYMQFDVPAGMNSLRPDDLPKHYEKYWENYSHGKFSHDGVTRHYSLVNFDEETDELTFNIRWQTAKDGFRAGVGSSYLGSLQVGEMISARGPFSEFYATSNKRVSRVFIGAGSGLAPLRAIIFEQLKKRQYEGDLILIYGARTEDDLLYHDELNSLCEQHDNFSYIPTLSNPSEQWQGRSGYVQRELLSYASQKSKLLSTEFYLCGPEAMMSEVERIITDVGIPSNQIFKDKFNR